MEGAQRRSKGWNSVNSRRHGPSRSSCCLFGSSLISHFSMVSAPRIASSSRLLDPNCFAFQVAPNLATGGGEASGCPGSLPYKNSMSNSSFSISESTNDGK